MNNYMIKMVFTIAVLVFVKTSHAEVKVASEHGFSIENRIETSASSAETWKALTEQIDLWWPKDHSWWNGTFSIDATAGGCFCEILDEQSAEHMRIVFVDPEKTLRMVGGLGPLQGMGLYGAMDWSFATTENGNTSVTLRYTVQGVNEDGFEQLAKIVDHVQTQQLGGLKTHLQLD